jgi:hypothetical protein
MAPHATILFATLFGLTSAFKQQNVYTVTATRLLQQPLIDTSNSVCRYTFNTAMYEKDGSYFVVNRCQNVSVGPIIVWF